MSDNIVDLNAFRQNKEAKDKGYIEIEEYDLKYMSVPLTVQMKLDLIKDQSRRLWINSPEYVRWNRIYRLVEVVESILRNVLLPGSLYSSIRMYCDPQQQHIELLCLSVGYMIEDTFVEVLQIDTGYSQRTKDNDLGIDGRYTKNLKSLEIRDPVETDLLVTPTVNAIIKNIMQMCRINRGRVIWNDDSSSIYGYLPYRDTLYIYAAVRFSDNRLHCKKEESEGV